MKDRQKKGSERESEREQDVDPHWQCNKTFITGFDRPLCFENTQPWWLFHIILYLIPKIPALVYKYQHSFTASPVNTGILQETLKNFQTTTITISQGEDVVFHSSSPNKEFLFAVVFGACLYEAHFETFPLIKTFKQFKFTVIK